jgi:hypothetical protein
VFLLLSDVLPVKHVNVSKDELFHSSKLSHIFNCCIFCLGFLAIHTKFDLIVNMLNFSAQLAFIAILDSCVEMARRLASETRSSALE